MRARVRVRARVNEYRSSPRFQVFSPSSFSSVVKTSRLKQSRLSQSPRFSQNFSVSPVSHIPVVSDERVVKNIAFVATAPFPRLKRSFHCRSSSCGGQVASSAVKLLIFSCVLRTVFWVLIFPDPRPQTPDPRPQTLALSCETA